MFTFSVGNVDPGATIDVKLHYFEVAAFDAGTYELVVPTTLGPTHSVDVARTNAKVADVKLKTDDVPNRDFVFRWRVAADTVKPAIFAHRENAGAPGYVSLMLEPSTIRRPTSSLLVSCSSCSIHRVRCTARRSMRQRPR